MGDLDHLDEIDGRFDSIINRLDRIAEMMRDLRRAILLWGVGVIAGLVGVIGAIFINGAPT